MKEEPALGSNFPDKHLYVMYAVRANVDFLPPSFLTTLLYVKLTVFTGSLKYWLAQLFTVLVAFQGGNHH